MSSSSLTRAAVLREHFASPNFRPRPILTSLNDDNAWLVSFPQLDAEAKATGRSYFHVVSDPWLVGPMVVANSWVFMMTAPSPPAFQDGAAVEQLAQEIEEAAATAAIAHDNPNKTREQAADSESPLVGAVFISLSLSDHMHEPTLRSFDSRIPVVAVSEAAKVIEGWGHFDTVLATQDLGPTRAESWEVVHPGPPLPPWLNVFRIPGHQSLNFAMAWIWTRDDGHREAMLLSPHGIRQDQPAFRAFLEMCQSEDQKTSVLAMLHGLKESFTYGFRNTLGVAGGLALDKAARPRYWVRSHDCVPTYTGLIGWFTRDFPRSLLDGITEYTGTQKTGVPPDEEDDHRPNLVNIENGESFILE